MKEEKEKNGTSVSGMHDPINGLDSNLLKVAVGLSALVFIIMLQAHHNHDPDSPHSGYITGVCHNIAVEVFDSVSLISALIGGRLRFLDFLKDTFEFGN